MYPIPIARKHTILIYRGKIPCRRENGFNAQLRRKFKSKNQQKMDINRFFEGESPGFWLPANGG